MSRHSDSQTEQPANVLVICSDQHHPGIVGYRQHPNVKTPNLDRLAESGTYFTRAYTNCAVCGPSRMSFMTGKYVHQIESWTIGVALPKEEKQKTWAARLGQNGIPSSCIGKIDSAGFEENHNPGFTHFDELLHRAAFNPYPRVTPFNKRLPGYTRPTSRQFLLKAGGGSIDKIEGNQECGFYGHDRTVTDKTLSYLREKGQSDQESPWCLYVGFLYPHWPYRVPQKYFDMYYPDQITMPHDACFPNDHIPPAMQEWQATNAFGEVTKDMLRRTISAYYGMITCMDDMIGEILDELEQQGLDGNTYVIYTSDHGESMGEHGQFFKHSAYEASVGIPLAMRGPGIPAGHVIDQTPVSLIDLYPTILDMVGLDPEPDLPGSSWLPLVRGEEHNRSDSVFAEWHGPAFRGAYYMLVRGDYKYIWYEFHPPSLYNLAEDPMEDHDLASDPDQADRLETFEQELCEILDPKATAMRAKKDLGLITEDGTDMTDSLVPWPGFTDGTIQKHQQFEREHRRT